MAPLPTHFTLSNGAQIPALGLGTYATTEDGVFDAVVKGIEIGYRHLDAAWYYPTETAVGRGIAASKVPRESLFLTTKVWNTHHRPEMAAQSLEESLAHLQTDYVDLLLIHWPVNFAPSKTTGFPIENGRLALDEDWNILDTYKAFEGFVDSGKVRAIGLSNFTQKLIEPILKVCKHRPAVNQVECNLWFQQKELREYCKKEGILLTAYAPLGHMHSPKCPATPEDRATLERVAQKYGKDTAQVAISYLIQNGICAIPKSFNPKRLETNLQTFEIAPEDLKTLAALDKGPAGRVHGGRDFRDAIGDAVPDDLVAKIDQLIWG